MNAGLTNLDTLKQHLLPGSMRGEVKFDRVIATYGRAIAGAFDRVCNRRLAWQENDTITFSGDRPQYYLPRFPIATVAAVQMKYFRTDAWTDITDQPISVNYENGLLAFGYTLGRNPLTVRVRWTGGYWFETNEPDKEGYPSTQPDVSADDDAPEAKKFLLPEELKGAFLMQCEELWSRRDKLGSGLVDEPGKQSKLGDLELSPLVKTILGAHVRYQLS